MFCFVEAEWSQGGTVVQPLALVAVCPALEIRPLGGYDGNPGHFVEVSRCCQVARQRGKTLEVHKSRVCVVPQTAQVP